MATLSLKNTLVIPKRSMKSYFSLTTYLLCLVDVGIHVGTICGPLLLALFLYSYETTFIKGETGRSKPDPLILLSFIEMTSCH
jgi:hypothetical protein